MNIVLAAVLMAAAPVNVDFRGTLGEALSTIANKGGINLIATGDLNTPAEVHLKDVTAEEALEALVKVHHLELAHEGKLWIVKPVGPAPLADHGHAMPAIPAIPAIPAVPAVPQMKNEGSDEPDVDGAEQRAEEAQQRAEEARDRADRIREAKEAEAEAQQEEIAAQVEEAKAKVDEFRAKAKELKSNQRVATGSIKVSDGEHVQDVVTYGGSVTLGDGVIADGSVVAFGGDVVLGKGDIVNGDAVSIGGTVKKGPGTIVNGEEVSFGTAGFGVHALPTVKPTPSPKKIEVKQESSGFAAFLIYFATLFGLGFLLMMFAPNRMRNIETEIMKEPVKSGLAGALALLGSVPLCVFLFLSVIGWPVLLAVTILSPLVIVMGMLAMAYLVGARIPLGRFKRTQALALAGGLLVMMLLSMVPVLGALMSAAAICVSFGAIIRTRVGQRALAGVPIPETSMSSSFTS
jgi:hypothetical protein